MRAPHDRSIVGLAPPGLICKRRGRYERAPRASLSRTVSTDCALNNKRATIFNLQIIAEHRVDVDRDDCDHWASVLQNASHVAAKTQAEAHLSSEFFLKRKAL